ncbi:MmgE/PrpD family protein [Oceanobacillus saliphilus]|uniref:MmgE/PrpD family protein n=1 Tax=Oceanobacillus saliphilus TaxID=2925834 RepID=UPI00201E6E51|nr:MmgE/PrpD family protein [Oceanobacillus saliphilus]
MEKQIGVEIVSPNLMDKMVDFINSTEYDNLPPELQKISKFAIIDTFSVALAGWNESSIKILRDTYSSRQSDHLTASLWGESKKFSIEYAALINGTATHVLDYDDVTPSVLAHSSAPIVSAIIPVSEYLGKSGKELITAYVIGTEVMIRVGQVMGFEHYDLGWHATSTLGTIGAAAACGYLFQLDEEKLSNAISIAASMAGGLQKNFGTMTKPLHVGLAAQNAIHATLLADKGYVGNRNVFEERGFFNAFGGEKSWGHFKEKINRMEFGKPYDYLANGLSIKKYPCCYLTHRFIYGVENLRQEFNLTLDDVSEIDVKVPKGGLLPLIYNRPQTGLQGKFSAEYTCLAALEDGKITLQSFTDRQVSREEIQQKLPIVKVSEVGGTPKEGNELDEIPVVVTIKTNNGNEYEKSIKHAPGSKELPMSDEERKFKWMDCFTYYFQEDSVNQELEKEIIHHFEYAGNLEEMDRIEDWLSGIHELVKCKGLQKGGF